MISFSATIAFNSPLITSLNEFAFSIIPASPFSALVLRLSVFAIKHFRIDELQ
jgi:hypothetical protein